MKNRKGRREEGLPASCSAQPAQPATGPASPANALQPASRSAHAAQLAAQHRPCAHRPRLRYAVTMAPRDSRTSPMPARLPVSACSRCPLDPARQRYCASSPRRAQTTARQSPNSNGRVGQGSCPRHGPVSPLRRAHATPRTPLDASSRPDRP